MKDKQKAERVIWVDVLRGIGIFLVLLGHRSRYYLPHDILCWIYVYHIPLFFFISGMFCPKAAGKSDWLKKRIRTLIIPYCVLGILYLLSKAVLYSLVHSSTPVSWCSLLDGNNIGPLWFLPTLFFVEFIYLSIRDVCNSAYTFIVLILLAAFLGYYINSAYLNANNIYVLPYHMNAVLIMLPFYWAGDFYFREKRIPQLAGKAKTIALFIVALWITFFVARCNKMIDIYYGVYGNYLLFYIGAFSGIIACIYVAQLIDGYLKSFTSFFAFLGKNTLVLLAFHNHFYKILEVVFGRVGLNYVTRFPVFNTLLTIIGLIPAIYLFSNYLPFAVGKTVHGKQR